MSIVQTIFGVFTEVITWFTTAITSISGIFYGDDGLTFIGTISLAGLGVAVVLMLVNLVKRYLQFR